jgi:hypothetical protein
MSSCYTEEGMRAAGQVPAYVEASSGEFVRVESATPDELKHAAQLERRAEVWHADRRRTYEGLLRGELTIVPDLTVVE